MWHCGIQPHKNHLILLNSLGHINARVQFFPFKITPDDRDSNIPTATEDNNKGKIKPITLPNYQTTTKEFRPK